MKKFKKFMVMGCAVAMSMTAMGINAFASETTDKAIAIAREAGLTVVENMIDYSIYGEDMVYIQEHADMVEEYNNKIKSRAARATSYTAWDMSKIFSFTTRSGSLFAIPYYFVPTSSAMYFNATVKGISQQPFMTINIVTDPSAGTLDYQGTYYIPQKSGETTTYEWSNYKRPLTSGEKYAFTLIGYSNWSYASMDISKSSM